MTGIFWETKLIQMLGKLMGIKIDCAHYGKKYIPGMQI
jgi:hypothetical protein